MGPGGCASGVVTRDATSCGAWASQPRWVPRARLNLDPSGGSKAVAPGLGWDPALPAAALLSAQQTDAKHGLPCLVSLNV